MSARKAVAVAATVLYVLHTLAAIALIMVGIFTTITLVPGDPNGGKHLLLMLWIIGVTGGGPLALLALWACAIGDEDATS